MENSNNIREFWNKHKGAIIGAIIAIILIATSLYKVLVGFVIVVAGIYFGNYIQKNKEEVKDKLKNFIDRF